MPHWSLRLSHVQGVNVNRPRAADDFEVIRERLEELRREREAIENANKTGDDPASDGGAESDGEGTRRERSEGAPPAWVPTIFLPQPTD
jgi:hypothetical protein